ncbi:hypothetical protein LOK49_LG04G03361 [Camellia lanceoleosa]|uniref:Uncharacterized protein n=1 Tax=Camellia lanceoleosa TaxID=1840588 RepID=A0ACC0I353_9ERIC|nr:hypothetical protein LOK49_LG04G03361 [Camellia lanceoleosa]
MSFLPPITNCQAPIPFTDDDILDTPAQYHCIIAFTFLSFRVPRLTREVRESPKAGERDTYTYIYATPHGITVTEQLKANPQSNLSRWIHRNFDSPSSIPGLRRRPPLSPPDIPMSALSGGFQDLAILLCSTLYLIIPLQCENY